MIFADLHVHSNYCDGRDEPEALVLAALERGLKTLGILAHSYVSFDPKGSLPPEREREFVAAIGVLKEKYKGQIKLLCGMEKDVFSEVDTSAFDYVIGSVHYFSVDGKYYPVDLSEETFCRVVQECFDGDFYAAAENYFRSASAVVERTGADVIGHFDLIAKYNGENKYFDPTNSRYVSAWKGAVDRLIKYGKPFEINTGGIYRGYRSEPYPSLEIGEYIKASGGKLILSSDAHNKNGLAFEFDKWKERI